VSGESSAPAVDSSGSALAPPDEREQIVAAFSREREQVVAASSRVLTVVWFQRVPALDALQGGDRPVFKLFAVLSFGLRSRAADWQAVCRVRASSSGASAP
jgi:hypothetical protein